MIQATARCAAPPRAGFTRRLLAGVKAALADLRRIRTADAESRREAVIRRDLAHLDRHQLRDIGLDRDAM